MDGWIDCFSLNAFYLLAEGAEVGKPQVVEVVSRVLHILSAMVLVGGLFYIRTVLYPAGEAACYADRRSTWAKWVGIATFFLLASGFYNFFMINGQAKEVGEGLPKVYHMLIGIKMLLGFLVMFIASILAGKTSLADRFRTKMGMWLNIGWLSAMAIVVIGAVLRSLH